MKFGRRLETESVPEWSLHNIDYNTLKEYIKVHTKRDQASAITIPGQKDTALQRFETDFYEELCRQHDRVGLFVATKTGEINWRLRKFFPALCIDLPYVLFTCFKEARFLSLVPPLIADVLRSQKASRIRFTACFCAAHHRHVAPQL